MGLAFFGWRATSSPWWCDVRWKLDSPAAMALLLRGSTFTLYGGSVFTRWIVAPSRSRSTSSGLLLSAQSRRWFPRIHRVTRLGDRFVRRFGQVVRVAQAFRNSARVQQPG